MEALTLLKYWRGGASGGAAATATATTLRQEVVEPPELEEDDGDDDGPFFDLELALPCNEENSNLSLSLSPSDDLFFRGRFVTIEESSSSSSSLSSDSCSPVYDTAEPVSKLQLVLSLLKTATKLRVSVLGSKKSKSAPEIANADQSPPILSKFFTVKFRFEEVHSNPVVSLFTRDFSSKSSSGTKENRHSSCDEVGSEERRFVKDVLQKYVKMIKPFYAKRFGSEKLGLAEIKSAENGGKLGDYVNVPLGLRVASKHLGKSRSASSAPPRIPPMAPHQGSRRDDSLLQQQDGIQSAILHCKRSFNGCRGKDIHIFSIRRLRWISSSPCLICMAFRCRDRFLHQRKSGIRGREQDFF
ncbi:hypothetical protein Syun_013284 [Stephania yunnanensis]|uniref:Membrane-associated kinase regulator 2 n=1 Tax=Stephania yunnanensis TaxID=152371 RepID=A0AAP0K1S9_9MAGN